MPAVGHHLVEIYLAERDKQRDEDHHGEDDVHHGAEAVAQVVELRYKVERQVNRRADGNRHGQRPVLQKSQQSVRHVTSF